MSSVSSSIRLSDQMTPAIRSMMSGMNSMIAGFEKMETASGSAIDTKSMAYARSEMAKAGSAFQQFEKSVSEANKEQKEFNNTSKASGGALSGLAGKVGALAGAYFTLQGAQKVINLSDAYQQTTARLDLMNDGLQTTQELQDRIFESANASKSSYQGTADMVSKLGLLAGDAFSNSDEIVDFAEQVSKNFVISGASASESSNAMLQLTQAMASGVLRGDELNSLFENSPTLIQSIADFLEVPIGQIRTMASDGEITADIIKKSMAKSAGSTNEKFEKMGMTFGQAWTVFQNKSSRAFQGVFEDLGKFASSDELDSFLDTAAAGLAGLTTIASSLMIDVGKIFSGSGIGEGGLVGFLASGVDSAKTIFGTAAEVILSHSGEMETSFDNAVTAWDDLFTRLTGDSDTLQSKSIGEFFGDQFVQTVKDFTEGAQAIAMELQIIGDVADLIFGDPVADIEEYGSSAAAWDAKMDQLKEDQQAYKELIAGFNTETFTKPIEEMYQGAGNYSTAIGETSAQIGASTSGATEIVKGVALNMMTAFPETVNENITNIHDSAAQIPIQANLGAQSIPLEMGDSGTRGMAAFIGAFINGSGDTRRVVDGVRKEAKRNLNGTIKDSSSIGIDSMTGFNNAFKDTSASKTAVGNLVNIVVSEFKSGLGIHSPSAVMYDIGLNTIAGLLNALSGEDLLKFCNNIVEDIKSAFEAGNFNIQVGTEFLGDGAAEFFQSIGVGGATIEGLVKPVDGAVTSGFGWRSSESTNGVGSNWHEGIDIGAGYGTAVGAAGAGKVTTAGWYGGYGNTVILDHSNGLETLYAHLSSIMVSVGQMVAAGQTIGLVGSTGNSTGPHLHFGIYKDGMAIDPGALWGYSSGTQSARPGLHLVGENGPEMIGFNGGETVLNSKKTKDLRAYRSEGVAGGGDIHVTVHVHSINNEMDAARVGRLIAKELQDTRNRTATVQIA